MATTLSLDAFIRCARITMTAERVDRNPHMDYAPMDHWKCRLRAGRRSMTVYFSKGFGHKGAEPAAAEVLNCLAMDASGYENAGDFESWCSEYGYDADSRKAERTYKAVEKQVAALRRFLGAESTYKTLLWGTERP